MKTIPASWQMVSDRDYWFCTNGTPIILIRIRRATGGYIRMGSKFVLFQEEGGSTYSYDDKFFHSIGSIDMGLNIMQGDPGGVGYMSATQIIINNGEYEGDKFTDNYSLDALINATVDIFFYPEECNHNDIDNALQIYKGKISNYSLNSKKSQIILNVNEWSITKQRKIPERLVDFNNRFAKDDTWTIPEICKNKVVPFCFGEGMKKVIQCDITSHNDRTVKLIMGYPIYTLKDFDSKLYYWDSVKKSFVMIDPTNIDEKFVYYQSTATKCRTMNILDIGILPLDCKQRTYLTPTDAIKYLYVDPDEDVLTLLSNKNVNLEYYQQCVQRPISLIASSIIPYANLTQGNWLEVWRVKFNRNDLLADIKFDLYLVIDLVFDYNAVDPSGVFINTRILSNITGGSGISISNSDYDYKSGAGDSFYYHANNPKEYIKAEKLRTVGTGDSIIDLLHEYPRGYSLFEHRIKQDMEIPDITDPNECILNIECWRIDADTRDCNLHNLQTALLILPMTLLIDYYVDGNFEAYDKIQAVISAIFEFGLSVNPADFVEFVNLARDYEIDGEIYEEDYSFNFLSKFAKEIGLWYYDSEEGKARFIDINTKSADYTIKDEDLLEDDNGNLELEITKAETEIYSRFSADYCLNIANKKYSKTRYIDKDEENFDTVSPTDLQDLCRDAYELYDSEKRLVVKLDYVRNDQVAEEILAKCVKQYTMKPTKIKFKTSLRMCDLQKGDQIKFNTRIFSSNGKHYYITRKNASYMWDNPIIEYEATESPWSS